MTDTTEKEKDSLHSKVLSANNDLIDAMKQSFEFWHDTYGNSLINYPLVWKKALDTNSQIIKKIEETWKNNTKQNAETQIQLFLELWSYAIRKSNFEIAKKSMLDLEDFWKDTTDKQFQIYREILELIETYWKDIQSKNFE